MKPLKPWLSFADQLQQLQDRGLQVDKPAAALDYLERLGYGRAASMERLTPELLPDFEKDLDAMRRRIAGGSFCGNEAVLALVEDFLRDGALPGRS